MAKLKIAVTYLVVALTVSLPVAAAQGAEVPWLGDVQSAPAAAPATQLSSLWKDATSGDLKAWQLRRQELRRAWLEWLGPMPQRPQTTAWTVLRTDELPDVTRHLIEYEGEPGLRVQAYVLRSKQAVAPRSQPGIVALHPTTTRTIEPIAGLEGNPDQHTGLSLARRGFVVICPRCFLWQDAVDYSAAVAQHRQRHPQTLGMHKMLYDAQRAVDLLAAQPDVDPHRLGAYGHSLGGKETLYLAAFDERIRAAVASEGGVEFSSTNWEAPWYLGSAVRDPQLARNHHELIAMTAPRPFLILGGESGPGAADGDRSWPYIAAALPIYRLYGEPPRVGLFNHHEGHKLSSASLEKLAEWLLVYTR